MKIPNQLVVATLVLACTASSIERAQAWGRFDGGDHPDFNRRYVRQRPEVIHRNFVVHDEHGGCVGCGLAVGAVAGLITGAIIGSAIANSANQTPPPEVVQAPQPTYAQPTYAQPPAPQYAQPLAPGTEVAQLPQGCQVASVNSVNYYQCGPMWLQPFFGGNGVYYTVIQPPS